MRVGLALLPISMFASTALAQPMPQQLADPAALARVTDAMQSLSKALLDMKIGGVQAALEGRKATAAERNLTVGDLARRDDPEIDRHLNEQIAAAKPKIEQGVRAMNQAMPEITADLQRAHKALERAIANMPDPNYPRR